METSSRTPNLRTAFDEPCCALWAALSFRTREQRAARLRSMATTVVLTVTPRDPRGDPYGAGSALPADLAHVLTAAGVSLVHGWSRHGGNPWRMRWQLSGSDRVALGKRLEEDLQGIGYAADVTFWP